MAEEATRLCEQILTQLQIFFASLQQLQNIQKRFFPPLLWNWWKSHNTEKLKQTAIYFRIWGHTHHFDRIWDHQVAMLTVRVVPPNSGSLSISQQCDRVNWWSEKSDFLVAKQDVGCWYKRSKDLNWGRGCPFLWSEHKSDFTKWDSAKWDWGSSEARK